MDVNDRRANARPSEEDYQTPLSRRALTEANRLFRENGVQAVVGKDSRAADRIVKRTVKERFNGRRKGAGDFSSVGEYLDYLNGLAG